VGGPAAFVNAVIDAIAHLGVRNIDMPCLSGRVWKRSSTSMMWPAPTASGDVNRGVSGIMMVKEETSRTEQAAVTDD